MSLEILLRCGGSRCTDGNGVKIFLPIGMILLKGVVEAFDRRGRGEADDVLCCRECFFLLTANGFTRRPRNVMACLVEH